MLKTLLIHFLFIFLRTSAKSMSEYLSSRSLASSLIETIKMLKKFANLTKKEEVSGSLAPKRRVQLRRVMCPLGSDPFGVAWCC